MTPLCDVLLTSEDQTINNNPHVLSVVNNLSSMLIIKLSKHCWFIFFCISSVHPQQHTLNMTLTFSMFNKPFFFFPIAEYKLVLWSRKLRATITTCNFWFNRETKPGVLLKPFVLEVSFYTLKYFRIVYFKLWLNWTCFSLTETDGGRKYATLEWLPN